MCIWTIYISSFVNYRFRVFAHYFLLDCIFIVDYGGSINILDRNSLSDIGEYFYC